MLDYYGIDTIPLHDDNSQNALQMVMNWLSYYADSQCNTLQNSARSRKYSRREVMSLSSWCQIIMELIPSFCMTIGCLQYYHQIVNKLLDSWMLAIHHKPSSCLRVNTIWSRDSNPKSYSKIIWTSKWIVDGCELVIILGVMSWVSHNDGGLLCNWYHTSAWI